MNDEQNNYPVRFQKRNIKCFSEKTTKSSHAIVFLYFKRVD